MENEVRRAPFYRMLIALASVVIIIAGLRAGSSIVGPFLLTFVIALFAIPLEFILVRRKVPGALAFLIVFALVVVVILLTILAVSVAAAQFQASQAMHQQELAARTQELAQTLERFGFTVTNLSSLSGNVEPFNAVAVVVDQMLKILSDSFLVIMLLFFLLMDAPGFISRLQRSAGYNNALIQNFGNFVREFLASLYTLTALNLLQAFYILVFLAIAGVDYAALWAFLGFLMLYLPVIGLFLAAVPAIFTAWLQYGWGMAFVVAIGILVVPFFFQRYVQARFVTRTGGVSLVVVFFAVIFSAWIFGLSGLLLSVPIVFTLQIIFESFPETHWLATLMGSGDETSSGTA